MEKKKTKPTAKKVRKKVKLLSGGNPHIAKGDGNAPVQLYIKNIPGWKQKIGKEVDRLVSETVSEVIKAVKWNSPFYGVPDKGWFLSFHCFTKYVKITFFKGSSLNPLPPQESKNKEVRYLDVYEQGFDRTLLKKWIKQASKLPGWMG